MHREGESCGDNGAEGGILLYFLNSKYDSAFNKTGELHMLSVIS